MKRLILLLCFITAIAKSQTIINNQVIIGTTDTLRSKILGEKMSFWISLPTNYNNPRYAKTRYPVVYVLDGDANFATVSSMARQLIVRNGNSVLPEVIVVGVMNHDRARDFTPYPSTFWIMDTPSPLENTGGGENFVKYLQQELITHIDSLYMTSSYRVLIGHSLGGLAATNVLVHHTNLFSGYIIVDPSMWYDNQGFLKQAQQALQQSKYGGVSLYLGIANSMPPGMDTLQLLKDTSRIDLHMRSVMQLKNSLKGNPQNGLSFKYGYYDDDTHMSAPLITEYDGLRFIFNFYHLPSGTEARMFNPYDHTDPSQILTVHFQQVSKYLGYQMTPSESLVNILANTMTANYLPEKALSLYQLNAGNFPASYGAWESLGDFYKDQKNKDKAVVCYQKALKIKDDKGVQDKLSKMIQEK